MDICAKIYFYYGQEYWKILLMKSNGCSLKWKEKRGTSFVHLKIKLLALPVIRINICSLNTHPNLSLNIMS